jgi:hypothetical protein
MKSLRKYVLSAFAVVVLSLTLANVVAAAAGCPPEDHTEQYSCYNTGEDDCFCYYDCYCYGSQDECDLALFRNGYMRVE